ncbi:helix-turn-helix domain-containing protein, partial [Vibrio sp. F13]
MRFSDRLKTQRKLKGLTQESIAQCLSLTKVAISRWERGHSIPSGDVLNTLATILEVNAEWLLTGKNENEGVILVDFYKDVYASAGNGSLNENEGTEQYPLSANIVNNEGANNLCCIRVTGQSMIPVLSDGSIVALNIQKKAIRDGMMYVIRQRDLLRVKILIETPGQIIIRSYNHEFKDEFFIKNTEPEEGLVIIGQVVWYS